MEGIAELPHVFQGRRALSRPVGWGWIPPSPCKKRRRASAVFGKGGDFPPPPFSPHFFSFAPDRAGERFHPPLPRQAIVKDTTAAGEKTFRLETLFSGRVFVCSALNRALNMIGLRASPRGSRTWALAFYLFAFYSKYETVAVRGTDSSFHASTLLSLGKAPFSSHCR